tara:strand:- start:240 stop:446 length:207 start_codon:yes stop_codon:yes gene_type:complete
MEHILPQKKISDEVRSEVFNFLDYRCSDESRVSMWDITLNTKCKTIRDASSLYGEWIVKKYKKSDEEE